MPRGQLASERLARGEPHAGRPRSERDLHREASDDDGDTLESEWDLDGGTDYGEALNQFEVTRSFSTVGSHTVKVRVGDGTASRSTSVTIDVLNRAPVASFSRSPANPQTLEAITFTSTSSDPDGDPIATRSWDLDNDGVFGEAGESGNSVSRSFGTSGSYPIKLRVTDSFGAGSSIQTQNVTVANRAPVPSFTVFPGSPLTGDEVTLDSTASSDPDGSVQSRAWDLDNDGEFDDGAGTTATRTFALPGTFTVRLQVVDNNAAPGVSIKTVTVGNRLPAASFTTTPAGPRTGDALQFDASASSDPEGVPMSKYEWDFDGDGTYDAYTGSTANASHAYWSARTYTVRLRVTDAHGGKAVTTRTVTVSERPTATGGGSTGGTVGTTGGTTGGTGQPGKIDAKVTTFWRLFGKKTQVGTLTVGNAPVGSKVTVTCKGKGCKFKRLVLTLKGSKLALAKKFKKKKLAAKTVITITVSKDGMVAKTFRYQLRAKKFPKLTLS